jgi:hypothetical protein
VSSRSWTLSTIREVGTSPNGPHTVSVKFRDQYGTESPEYQASTILDITPPAVTLTLNDGAATTHNPSVKVDWSSSDSPGLMQMTYTSFNEGDSFYLWSTPLHFFTPVQTYHPDSKTIKFSPKPGRKTVMVRFVDAAGNVTHAQASIQLQPAAVTFLPLLLGD